MKPLIEAAIVELCSSSFNSTCDKNQGIDLTSEHSSHQSMDLSKQDENPPRPGSSNSSVSQPPKKGYTGGKTALSGLPVPESNDSGNNRDAFLQSQLDVSVGEIKNDLMSWMDTDKGNQENCFDLLRQMELVDEEGNVGYDYEIVSSGSEQQTDLPVRGS